MSEMVERVAKALGATLIPGSATVTAEYVVSAELIGRFARAAIEAMREPTEAMVKASQSLWTHEGPYHSEAPGEEQWPAMIDEALK